MAPTIFRNSAATAKRRFRKIVGVAEQFRHAPPGGVLSDADPPGATRG